MEIKWLFIGLPIAFILGWLAARLDISHVLSVAKEYPHNLFNAFSNLLNGNKDKALSNLIQAAEKNQSVPLQFLIGALAQQQGDFQRSMPMHQALYEREDLSAKQRNKALWALTNDYYKIGFFDYAESYAQSLQNDAEYKQQAFKLLLEVYQRRHLYDKAIALIEEVCQDNTPHQYHQSLSYFYCMRAQKETDIDNKFNFYNKALKSNPLCTSAQLALAGLWLEKKDYAKAYGSYEMIEKQNIRFLWLAVDGLVQSARGVGEEKKAMGVLLRWLKDYPSGQLFKKVYAALIVENIDVNQLSESFFIQQKSFLAAAFWLERQNLPLSTEAIMELKAMLMSVATDQFVCQQCHYISTDFTWSCPGCLQWETLFEKKT